MDHDQRQAAPSALEAPRAAVPARPLRVLLVEDSEDDAALVLRELGRAHYVVEWQRVDTPEAMRAALDGRTWDLILSDYHMPRFDALQAYAVLKERALDLPFIIVSGTVGEEVAVEAMRVGVQDYLLKGALTRLPVVVERELREAAHRSDHRTMQEHLLISDRMASVGTLAAGVAHEINNPLAAVLANLDFSLETLTDLMRDLQPASAVAHPSAAELALGTQLAEVEAPLRDAREAADRVRLIVRDLKIFSRSGDEERTGPVDLKRVLDSSSRMAWNEIRHRARLVKDYAEIPPALGNESRLGQVFLNLIVNAAQAIPEGKTDHNEIRLVTRQKGNTVVVEVHDSGAGIAPDVVPRIFDSFFTTKAAGVGTGLGLAICHRIVTEVGGTIEVQSKEGEGSVFRVTLPIAPASEEDEPTNRAWVTDSGPRRRGAILVVDDEPLMHRVVYRMLAPDHDLTSFASVREALECIRGGRSFDVILCDLLMPEMTGMDLHAELLRTAPRMAGRLVFMTGGAFTARAREYLDKVENPRIEKPFDAQHLRLLIQRMLLAGSPDGRPPSS
jgi:signal transduction histidine kinase